TFQLGEEAPPSFLRLPRIGCACHQKALGRTRYSYQFAWRDLGQFLSGRHVFDDEGSLFSPSRNIAYLSSHLHHFVELEPSHLPWCPTFVLTMEPIEALILAPRQTTDMIGCLQWLDLLTDLAGDGHRIVGVGLWQVEDLD